MNTETENTKYGDAIRESCNSELPFHSQTCATRILVYSNTENIEQAAEKYASEQCKLMNIQNWQKTWMKSIFIYVAKWQRTQSEAEIRELNKMIENFINEIEALTFIENWRSEGRRLINMEIEKFRELLTKYNK